MLRLSVFGTLSATLIDAQGSARPLALGGRPGSLLAYLALARGRLFSRGELAATLWADRGDAAGAGTFNTTLWRLRRAIETPPIAHGELIVCDRRGAVGLHDSAHLTLDVDEFTRLVVPALAKPLSALTEADVEALRRGVALYTGDVLSGLADDWVLREREKHRRHQLNALGRLMQLSAMGGDAAGGIRHAQAILDLDMLREDVHRELMRFYLMAGQRALALRQYETCRAALKRELAIQPMRETVAYYQRIANSALGIDGEPDAPAHIALQPGATRAGGASPSGSELIAAARRYLAAADAQLQLTLPFFDPPVQ